MKILNRHPFLRGLQYYQFSVTFILLVMSLYNTGSAHASISIPSCRSLEIFITSQPSLLDLDDLETLMIKSFGASSSDMDANDVKVILDATTACVSASPTGVFASYPATTPWYAAHQLEPVVTEHIRRMKEQVRTQVEAAALASKLTEELDVIKATIPELSAASETALYEGLTADQMQIVERGLQHEATRDTAAKIKKDAEAAKERSAQIAYEMGKGPQPLSDWVKNGPPRPVGEEEEGMLTYLYSAFLVAEHCAKYGASFTGDDVVVIRRLGQDYARKTDGVSAERKAQIWSILQQQFTITSATLTRQSCAGDKQNLLFAFPNELSGKAAGRADPFD